MARNTAEQGARLERRVRAELEEIGYVTLRSAGSKGKVDVVAFGYDEVLVVQCKWTNPQISPAERQGLLEVELLSGAIPLVASNDRGKTVWRRLLGPGPKDWMSWHPRPEGENDE